MTTLRGAFVPLALRRASVPVADVAITFLRRKYGIDAASTARAEAAEDGSPMRTCPH